MRFSRRKIAIFGGGLAVFAAAAALLFGPIVSSIVERPRYTVLRSDGDFEVRRYAPMLIAEVSVSGDRDQAIGDGFRLLAGYIFGNNISQTEMSMTAPVQQRPSQEISMTAPVQQQRDGHKWFVSFVMPSAFDISTLPLPNDPRVEIREIPVQEFVTIRFSGLNSKARLKEETTRLRNYVESNGLRVKGEAKYAFYNPPSTLPVFRRNEIMYQLVQ